MAKINHGLPLFVKPPKWLDKINLYKILLGCWGFGGLFMDKGLDIYVSNEFCGISEEGTGTTEIRSPCECAALVQFQTNTIEILQDLTNKNIL